MRTIKLLAGLGREIGPAVVVLFTAVSATAFVSPLLLAVGLRPLVDGIVSHRTGQAVTGAALTAVGLTLSVLAPAAYRWTTIRMRERSILVMQRRLLTLSTTAEGLEHFERPEFWDRLQLLKRSAHDLAMGITLALIVPIVVGQLVVTAVLLGQLHPVLVFLPVLAIPATWLRHYGESLRRKAELRTAEDRRGAQHLFTLSSSRSAAKEIRLYGLHAELLARHQEKSQTVHRETERALFRSVAIGSGSWFLFAAAYLGSALLVLREAADGRATPGDVALTLALATAVVAAAGRLTELAGSALKARTASEHYYWLQDLATPARGKIDPPQRLVRGIHFENVTFTYPDTERPVLSDVDLHLPAGAVIAVVGENGAGKTTLVKLLCGMYLPDTGRILIDGVDLSTMDIEAYRGNLTAGFQDFARFELLLRESVGIGDLAHMDDLGAVQAALRKANAHMDTMDTQLGPSWAGGVDLSGGEWQKLALARSMMRSAPLLSILDEPTASLDPHTEHALFEQIAADSRQARADGRITLLISHRFSTVRMADLIIVLTDGRIVECGTHEQLVDNGGLYAELYQLQASAYR